MNFEYIPKSQRQLKNNYTSRIRREKSDFPTFEDFKKWYDEKAKYCYYCRLSEIECQEIVVKSMLTSNRFPKDGKPGQGTSRGMWLEVDRLNP
jgi:hypothetical protein